MRPGKVRTRRHDWIWDKVLRLKAAAPVPFEKSISLNTSCSNMWLSWSDKVTVSGKVETHARKENPLYVHFQMSEDKIIVISGSEQRHERRNYCTQLNTVKAIILFSHVVVLYSRGNISSTHTHWQLNINNQGYSKFTSLLCFYFGFCRKRFIMQQKRRGKHAMRWITG